MTLDPKPIVDGEPEVEVQEAVAEPSGVPTSDEFIERVNQMTPGDISPEIIRAVLTATNHATQGDPIGTIRQGPNGEFAQRINLNGVDQWSITTPTGERWYDYTPTLDWPKIGG